MKKLIYYLLVILLVYKVAQSLFGLLISIGLFSMGGITLVMLMLFMIVAYSTALHGLTRKKRSVIVGTIVAAVAIITPLLFSHNSNLLPPISDIVIFIGCLYQFYLYKSEETDVLVQTSDAV